MCPYLVLVLSILEFHHRRKNRTTLFPQTRSVNASSIGSCFCRPRLPAAAHANPSSLPLQLCPVCRSAVDHVQHIYLPTCTSLLNLKLTDNHQHHGGLPPTIHRELPSPHTEYEPKMYHT